MLLLWAPLPAFANTVFLVDDDPLAMSPESLHVLHRRLNRFCGYITVSWQDHQVREVKPEGALRSVKKR